MTTRQINRVFSQLRFIAARKEPGQSSDADLIERFLARGEEVAFESLVRRHGPMVLGVCRRLLDDEHDAEDAFQATFLVLIRKASSIRPCACVGPWLYGVARRTALKARSLSVRRRRAEKAAGRDRPAATFPAATGNELRPLLDEELNRLPAKYRDPLVLCLLQEKSRKEAARLLGWSEGTLSGRLARGKEMLRERLRRRGVASGAALTAITAGAHVSAALAAKAVLSLAEPGARCLSIPVTTLMEEVLKSMVTLKLKAAVGMLVLVAGIGFGTGMAAWQRGPTVQAAGPAPRGRRRQAPDRVRSEEGNETSRIRDRGIRRPSRGIRLAEKRRTGEILEQLPGADGTINLGMFGSVMVSGLTLREARAAISKQLDGKLQNFDEEKLKVDVKSYGKVVYVIIHDAGKQIYRFPASECQTVLDALVRVQEVKAVFIGLGKKRVSIERKSTGDKGVQVLPVDVKAITQDGNTTTNYQLRPGDRVVVEPIARRDDDLLPGDAEAGRLPWPTREEVVRSLPPDMQVKKVTFEVVVQQVEEPRWYPLVGPARLARLTWKCTVVGDKEVKVIYLDRDRLIPCK